MCATSAELSHESSTVHSECLEVVEDRLDQERLWAATSWWTPSQRAPNLRLEVGDIRPDPSLASALALGRLNDLPLEIFGVIQGYLSGSWFWRCSAALDAARLLRIAPVDELSVPLRRVAAWERGHRPKITERASSELRIMQLTIDSRGSFPFLLPFATSLNKNRINFS